MTRLPSAPALLLALAAACASGTSGPPVTEPGAPPPTTAPAPPPERNPTEPATPRDEDADELETDAHAAGVRRLWRSSRSGFESPERLVVRNQAELSGVWDRLGAEAAPQVDFGRELVVVVAAGQKPTGGHSISLGRAVVEDEGVLVVEVISSAPGADCVTTQALTQPVDVVAIVAEGVKKWRFVEREEALGCGGE